MRSRTHWRPWAFVIVLSLSLGALFVSSHDLIVAPVAAQTDAVGQLRARFVNIAWLGPVGMVMEETLRFNYTNGGQFPVNIQWFITHAATGEILLTNYGKPLRIEAGKGAYWDLKGMDIGEDCYDMNGRAQVLLWLFVQHPNKTAYARSVDLPTAELFMPMRMDATGMIMSRTRLLIPPNTEAPGDSFYAAQALQGFEAPAE